MPRPKAIKSLQETPDKGGRNWLIYADSGAGKTVLGGTAPRALFLTAEAKGTESAKAFGSTADEWILNAWRDVQTAYEFFAEEEGCDSYDWVVMDSISELEDYAWKHVLKSNSRSSGAALQDYPEVWNKMKDLVDAWNRLPVNVLYTAQAFRLPATNEDGEDTSMLLPLVGSTKRGDTSQKICGKVTLVGFLDVRKRDIEGKDGASEEFRRLWISKTSRMFAKSRHHKGVRYLDEPTGEDKYLNIGEIDAEIRARREASRPAESPDSGETSEATARRKRRASTEAPAEVEGTDG